jgi:catechol 2,3-dioxygenase-like lactoylglutathione lyase family enzyme
MIDRVDHFVLTVQSVDATCEFYANCLDFERVDSLDGPTSLRFGEQKINVHQVDHTFEPTARHPTSGAGDFCLITRLPLARVIARLTANNVAVELGPVDRTGAAGPMRSIYFRDPDGNLVEVSHYDR